MLSEKKTVLKDFVFPGERQKPIKDESFIISVLNLCHIFSFFSVLIISMSFVQPQPRSQLFQSFFQKKRFSVIFSIFFSKNFPLSESFATMFLTNIFQRSDSRFHSSCSVLYVSSGNHFYKK